MTDPVTITAFELENVKRIKALRMAPSAAGLTILGGNNAQGKTSAIDALCWALGGDKRKPSAPQRDGAMNPPSIDVTLSNGIRVQRYGKNSSLRVTDSSGGRAGQALLDSFISEFALDLPKFLNATTKEKAKQLLAILGIGNELADLDQQEQRIYNERHAIGQIADAKRKHAAELPEYADAPSEPVSVSELIQRQQSILARNGENQRKRANKAQLERMRDDFDLTVKRLRVELAQAEDALKRTMDDLAIAEKSCEQLQDESTAEIEASLADIEAINAQVAANQAKAYAMEEAAQYTAQYDHLTLDLEKVRDARLALLDASKMPLPDLTIENGELLYRGQRWDCMSGTEQLRVAVAIVQQDKPQCGFVFVDKLEQFDLPTLQSFADWAKEHNLQVIGTRVSTGDECAVIIEDGLPQGETYADVVTGVNASAEQPWGEF